MQKKTMAQISQKPATVLHNKINRDSIHWIGFYLEGGDCDFIDLPAETPTFTNIFVKI